MTTGMAADPVSAGTAQQSTTATVRAVACEVLGERMGGVHDDDLLFANGIIDSLALVALIDRIETAFGITIEPDDLVPENFESINAMGSFVRRRS